VNLPHGFDDVVSHLNLLGRADRSLGKDKHLLEHPSLRFSASMSNLIRPRACEENLI